MNEGARVAYGMDVRFIETRRFALKQTYLHIYTNRAQGREAFA